MSGPSRSVAVCVALSLAYLCIPHVLVAQAAGAIRGTVRSSSDNIPIAGAQLSIPALRIGVLTNEDGRYLLQNVPAGTHTLSVVMIGYAPARREAVVVVGGQTAVADFQLRTQVLSVAEIVVTGVTEATSRAKLPFTVSKVSADAIPVPPSAAVSSVQGRVAGANMVQSTQPGEGPSIVLRTPTSINRTNSPLIVVDGAILTASSVDISSLDIESIEVVKGAAAASLYGSRAAAGVIQIRTTRGSRIQEGQTRFTVRSEYGTNSIMHPVEWSKSHYLKMNASQTRYLNSSGAEVDERQFATGSQYLFQDQPYPGKMYDNIAALFDPGQYLTNSVSLGFNGGNTSWLVTAGQHHTSGVVEGNDGYSRYDFRLNLDHRLRNDLSVSASAFHMRSKQEDVYGNTFFDFIHIAPDIDLLQPDPDGTKYIFQPDPTGVRPNPLYQLITQDRWDNRARTLGSMDLRYNPISWLAVNLNSSYDRSDRKSEDYIPRGAKTSENPTGGIGSSSRSSALTTGINVSGGVSATRAFGSLQTRVSGRALIEQEDNESISTEGADASVGGIPDLDAFLTPAIGSDQSTIRSRGYYLTADLDYSERYIFSGLVRRDGSSLFGRKDRWHTYYRASGAYRMSAEPWWPLASTVNEFKLRYSRGTAGGRPEFADRFEVFALTSSGLTLATLGNEFLRPEKTTEQEFGVDLVAFERLSLGLVHARQRTVDELISVPLPSVYGFTSQWQNAGTLEGNTWEATLEARLFENDDMRWSVGLVADRSRNRIIEYDRPCHAVGDANLGWRCAGEVIGQMWANRLWTSHADLPAVHGNSQDAFQVNDDGLLVPVGAGNAWTDGVAKNLWGTKVIIDGVSYDWGMPRRLNDAAGQALRVQVGDANPDLNWGFSTQFRRGPLTLYALFGGQIGGDVYNSTKQRMYQYARNREIDQDGKPEDRKKPATYFTGPIYNANTAISWFVEDATYTKLREASVRYNLTPRQLPLLGRTGAKSIWLSVVGRNLFALTDYSGYDPEIGGVLSRVDNFDFPTYRTVTFSVDIEF